MQLIGPSLLVIAGPSGSGKSTWLHSLLPASMIVSSDTMRLLLVDDEDDQTINAEAFELLGHIVLGRLRLQRTTIVDSTALTARDRKSLLAYAQEAGVPAHLIVINATVRECVEGNKARAAAGGRNVPERVIERHGERLAQTLQLHQQGKLAQEGWDSVHIFTRAGLEAVDTLEFVSTLANEFDIIGDVHGCATELQLLLYELGYEQDERGSWLHPAGRVALFVGDLTDRGDANIECLRTVDAMVDSGSALLASLGNHDWKLYRAVVEGRDVMITNGLERTIAEIDAGTHAERETVRNLIERLFTYAPAFSMYDNGKLTVTHASLPRELRDTGDSRTKRRSLLGEACLYGEKTPNAEGDLKRSYGWVEGWTNPEETLVFGHDVLGLEPQLLGPCSTVVALDTGCVYGGKLSAYRYPEKEVHQVNSLRQRPDEKFAAKFLNE